MMATWKAAAVASILWASILVPSTARAWGGEGHRIVALIAADRLTPAAHARVADLLGADVRADMEAVSTWADEIRKKRPGTERWHFVDIEISAQRYDAARDCPRGDCVVAQIRKDERLVADDRLARPARAEALRFLIHFVGDIHQPLHCADHRDRGGNAVRVMFGGEETNLHAVWDTAVVRALGEDPAAVAGGLEAQVTQQEMRAWSRGGPVDWANESFSIAKRAIYGPLGGAYGKRQPIQLPDDYAMRERPLAAEQLEKAGVRLATVLNALFPASSGGTRTP
ncbi:MAG: S1/P1 nuclease [Steroidobacteraceae bacterium]